MYSVLKKVDLKDRIDKMKDGIRTQLYNNNGEGIDISGGEAQRLAIARALLKKPEILIMDEATSNLDSITEKAIEKTIEDCTKNVTTIIIAHRLSTIMRCDRIYVMDKGEVIEEGNHDKLLKKQGYYYRLWTGQTIEELNEIAAPKVQESPVLIGNPFVGGVN